MDGGSLESIQLHSRCGDGMVGVQQQLAGNCITATASAAALEVAGRCRPAAVGLHCR